MVLRHQNLMSKDEESESESPTRSPRHLLKDMFEEVALTPSLRLGQTMTRLDQMMEMAGTAPVTAWILRTARVMAWILRTAHWPHHRQ